MSHAFSELYLYDAQLFPAWEIVNYYPCYHAYDIVDAAERMIDEKDINN